MNTQALARFMIDEVRRLYPHLEEEIEVQVDLEKANLVAMWELDPTAICGCGNDFQSHLDKYTVEIDGVRHWTPAGTNYSTVSAIIEVFERLGLELPKPPQPSISDLPPSVVQAMNAILQKISDGGNPFISGDAVVINLVMTEDGRIVVEGPKEVLKQLEATGQLEQIVRSAAAQEGLDLENLTVETKSWDDPDSYTVQQLGRQPTTVDSTAEVVDEPDEVLAREDSVFWEGILPDIDL